MRNIALFVILAFISATSNSTAEPDFPQPSLEAYGALPEISRAEISPDGTKVAMIANLAVGTRVAVFEVGVGIINQIGVNEAKARGIEFFDNDHFILRASETTTTYGFRGEYEYSAAISINIESLESNQLMSRAKDLFPAQSGLGRIVGRGEKAGEVLMPAFVGKRGSDPSLDLLVAKLDSRRGNRYVRGTPDTIDWFVGRNGRVLARERYSNGQNLYRVQWRRANGSWIDIYEEEDKILPMAIQGIMPDESGLVFLQASAESNRLMKLSSDGEITGPILPVKDREIEAIYTDNNRVLMGVRYAGIVPDYAFLDAELQDSFEKMSELLPNATIYLDSWSDDRNRVLYNVFDSGIGEGWIVHLREQNELNLIARSRPDIPAAAVGYMMSVNYKARDGLPIQAIVTQPPTFDPDMVEPLPTLMMPHGGPAAYDRFDFDWMAQYFANRGYLVIQPNFRGSTGFGQDFEDAGRGEWGGKMQDDLTDGVTALVKAGYVDPEQVCIVGASYGGYAALAGAVFTPELYQCVVAIAPVSDLNRMLSEEKRQRGKNHWVVSYWEDVMAEGDARRNKLRSISPVNFAENVVAPILLIHGDNDTVVPYSQSTRMRNALKRADKQVELVKLKGEDHWLSVAETRMQTLRAMDQFLATHMPVAD